MRISARVLGSTIVIRKARVSPHIYGKNDSGPSLVWKPFP